jgi:glycosyltransferase involved in cell wall biosynthesis
VLFLNTQDSLRADVSVHVSLAQALDRSSVRVSVATSKYESEGDSALKAFASIPDITLMSLDLGRPLFLKRGIRKVLAAMRNVRAVATLLRLAAWCRQQDVNVVHVTERPRDAAFGLLLARVAGAACVIHAHTAYYPHQGSLRDRVGDWILRQADAVVGVSEFTANTFRRRAGVGQERVFAVHNAVDRGVLELMDLAVERDRMRRRLGIPVDVPVVGSIARLMQCKDQASLVEAFRVVHGWYPDAHLVIAGLPADAAPDGRGNYRDYLERRVAELGLKDAVRFTGFLPHDEVASLYAAFDIFVHPSVEEPFGLVLVEAMACRRPVIAVDGGGVPEIIRTGREGVLLPPRRPDAIADAIVGLLGNPEQTAAMVRAALERVLTCFTPSEQAAQIQKVYERAVAPHRPAPVGPGMRPEEHGSSSPIGVAL